jgi:hypothetical protein
MSQQMSQQLLTTLIITHGQYNPTHPLADTELVPSNIRLFHYNFKEADYDNYYLSQIYARPTKTLFFVNKNTGKIFKKEYAHKEYKPGSKCPKGVVLSFNNIQHMMGISSIIIHPNGNTQDFHNNGKRDSFIISLCDLLRQLSASYAKLFPNETVEVHLSSHENGGNWENIGDGDNKPPSLRRKMVLRDATNSFTVEEKQNMEELLLRDFIVLNDYPQAKFASDLARKKTAPATIVKKTRTFFSKYRRADSHMKTYRHRV